MIQDRSLLIKYLESTELIYKIHNDMSKVYILDGIIFDNKGNLDSYAVKVNIMYKNNLVRQYDSVIKCQDMANYRVGTIVNKEKVDIDTVKDLIIDNDILAIFIAVNYLITENTLKDIKEEEEYKTNLAELSSVNERITKLEAELKELYKKREELTKLTNKVKTKL